MTLSAPKQTTWLIAVAAGALGVLVHYRVVHIALLAPYAGFLVVASWALLVVACLVKGL